MKFPKRAIEMYLKYLVSIVEILLVIRVLLRLFGASSRAMIVEFIYVVTGIIITPFAGIFNDIHLKVGGTIDLVAISAMIGYPVIAFLVRELLEAFVKDDEPLKPQKRLEEQQAAGGADRKQ